MWPSSATDDGGGRDDPEDRNYFEPSLFDEPRVAEPDDVHAAFLAANLLLLYLNLARLSTINDARPALPSPVATVREDRDDRDNDHDDDDDDNNDDDNKLVGFLFFFFAFPISHCSSVTTDKSVGGRVVRIVLHHGCVMVN